MREACRRSIASRLAVRRCDGIEDPLLQLKVGVQVDLGSLDRLVAKPERNNRQVDTLLQQVHCGRVAKHVGTHALLAQRWASPSGYRDMLG